MSEQLLVRLTKWNRANEMYSPMRRNTKAIVHKRFRQKLSSSGVRRETDNERRRKQGRGQTRRS